jgi:hypothetical protein
VPDIEARGMAVHLPRLKGYERRHIYIYIYSQNSQCPGMFTMEGYYSADFSEYVQAAAEDLGH